MLLRVRVWLKNRLTGRVALHPALDRQRRFDQQTVQRVRGGRWPGWRQLKLLPQLMSPAERRAGAVMLVLIIVSLALVGVRAWWRTTKVVPIAGGNYTEGLVGSPQYINPLLGVTNDVDRDLSNLVFCSLVRLDSAGQLVPDVATSIDVSPDGQTYTVTIRPDATWHDGSPVTMDDIAFTIGSLQDDTFATPVASVWADVDMQVKDDHVVTFHLPRPFPDFKQALTVGLLPAHAWRDIPAANVKLTTLNTKPIGCGSFAFSKLTRDSRGTVRTLTLHQHENYHGQKPYLDDIIFKFYPDYDTAVAALLNGNIQGLSSLPASAVKAAGERRNLVLHQLTIPQYTAAFFNLRSSDLLKRPEVRQALALVADRDAIVNQALSGQGQVVDGPVLPVPSGTAPIVGKPNLDAAKKVLTDSGWKQVDGKWQKDKVTLTIKLLAADRPEHKAIADELKKDWEALGISTIVELVDRPSLRDRVRTGDFEVVVFSESLGATGNPFAFWHSSQAGSGGLNISGWSNRDADTLLEQIRSTADLVQRQDALNKFQNLIHASQPALFLNSPTYTYPVSDIVRGIRADRLGTPADRFSGVADWYVKTKRGA